MDNQVLVIGCTQAGLQAAQDLANVGLRVNLVESSPFIGSDQNFNLPEHLKNTLLLEVLKNPRIKVWTNTDIDQISRNNSGYQIRLQQHPRYIDLSRCTACGDCVSVCPVTIPGTDLKAIHFGGQPDCAVIEKGGISPCTNACPAGVHVQGYVALINQGRFKEAYHLIYDALPFPSVCGRVCNHYCEQACNRSQLDFYKNLIKGKTKSESLRASKLEFITSADQIRAHPHYWAGYVVIGVNDPLYIDYSKYIILLIIIIPLLAIGLFLLKKRKN